MFPNEFKILITDEETNKPICNIAIQVTIFANRKNNYFLIPQISNELGIIEITKEFIEKEIETNRNLFIMDYTSTLIDCKSEIKVEILALDSINGLLNAMRMFPANYFQNDFHSIQSLNNWKFKPKSEMIKLTGEELVYYNLMLRKK
jgi:hypothetical protein